MDGTLIEHFNLVCVTDYRILKLQVRTTGNYVRE